MNQTQKGFRPALSKKGRKYVIQKNHRNAKSLCSFMMANRIIINAELTFTFMTEDDL